MTRLTAAIHVPTITAGRFVADKAKVDGYFPEFVRPKAARIGAQIRQTFSKAYSNGVKIGFGTGMGADPHGENAREFLYMVEVGMPAAAALQAATINAAQVLGVDDQGVVEARQRADIKTVLKVDLVMKDGVVCRTPAP